MSHRLVGRNRPQQVIEALHVASESLPAAQRQARFARMAASSRRFFDATNHLYWQDVWPEWRLALFGGWPETQTWLHGDARLHSFAAVGHAGQPIRYGLTGVDRALIGDYQLDLWRLAASLVLNIREHGELSSKALDRALWALAQGYRERLDALREGQSAKGSELQNTKGPLKAFLGKVADKQHPGRALDKWTELTEQQGRRFVPQPNKLANLPVDVASRLKRLIENDYPQTLPKPVKEGDEGHFRVKDTARRLNTLGVEHYYALLEGGARGEHDDVIIEVVEQTPPPAFHLLSRADQQGWRKLFPNEALRHAAAFHALAPHADPYLGWLTLNDRVFAVRRVAGFEKRLPTHKLKSAKTYRRLAHQWGGLLAEHHVQAAAALHREPARFVEAVCRRIDGREEAFCESVATFATRYADCVEQDYRLFTEHFMGGAS
ncbi:DUF2252 domain-containing protein [Halomonas sp. GD1P12]|uniref:DUF2252 domain-containing protein n=1 Tax=Halomonas sp. GD1P12 TaxID=2982691 RepID=UPI0021E40C0B|nr:DUF2252 domain-containing protein [Halomonas sp. GD1P12]UYF98929.1 DUF2252 domain-containing protein [Halomonas sp. GD1P12]